MESSKPIAVGSLVEVDTNQGPQQATVKFIGRTEFAEGEWVGVEFFAPCGKHDGSVDGVKYFSCPESCGLFVKPDRIHTLEFTTKIRVGAGKVATDAGLLDETSGSTDDNGQRVALAFTTTGGVHSKKGTGKRPAGASPQ
eukprot:GILK01008344.1.p1 GENE.GILK01008344.1~~GILK01008344.1.p1  ORF type:complete len:153 (+),score=16.29 GILK01008344.1:42-461(+)